MEKSHKTGQSYPSIPSVVTLCLYTGQAESAILVANKVTVKILVLWERLVSRCLESDYTFPEFHSNVFIHPERKIERAAKELGQALPTTPTAFQKEMEINKEQVPEERRSVPVKLQHQNTHTGHTQLFRPLIDGEMEGCLRLCGGAGYAGRVRDTSCSVRELQIEIGI